MANRPINYQALIPNSWYGVFVPDEEALRFLGKENLRALEHYWRNSAKNRGKEAEKYERKLNSLEELGLSGVHTIAARCGDLEFPEREAVKGKFGISQPVDAASLRRWRGDTDYRYCGWCRHFWGAQAEQGECVLSGRCSLIPPQYNNGSGWNGGEPFTFGHECDFNRKTSEFFDTCCVYLRTRVASAKWHQEEALDYAEYLGLLASEAYDKPILPRSRKLDHFGIGAEVLVCLPHMQGIAEELQGTFVTAKVVDVDMEAREVLLKTSRLIGEECADMLRQKLRKPTALLRWEYDYLRCDDRYRKIWLRNAEFHGSKAACLALKEGLCI